MKNKTERGICYCCGAAVIREVDEDGTNYDKAVHPAPEGWEDEEEG